MSAGSSATTIRNVKVEPGAEFAHGDVVEIIKSGRQMGTAAVVTATMEDSEHITVTEATWSGATVAEVLFFSRSWKF